MPYTNGAKVVMEKLTKQQFLETLIKSWTEVENKNISSSTPEEFPVDYQDTYDLGVHHGRLQAGKFFLNLYKYNVDEAL